MPMAVPAVMHAEGTWAGSAATRPSAVQEIRGRPGRGEGVRGLREVSTLSMTSPLNSSERAFLAAFNSVALDANARTFKPALLLTSLSTRDSRSQTCWIRTSKSTAALTLSLPLSGFASNNSALLSSLCTRNSRSYSCWFCTSRSSAALTPSSSNSGFASGNAAWPSNTCATELKDPHAPLTMLKVGVETTCLVAISGSAGCATSGLDSMYSAGRTCPRDARLPGRNSRDVCWLRVGAPTLRTTF
mmetsp:Transcript_86280/g.166059  ORF Transcript_86280/g.166059 Transcript_86280/m.166059 type:complete len:245 (-) Transcript_86280:136-870(-)